MISVIIPTMFKVDRLFETITELSNCIEVGEIILINNTNNNVSINIPKVRYIYEGKNTYVNPAWNKGVSLAKFNKPSSGSQQWSTDFPSNHLFHTLSKISRRSVFAAQLCRIKLFLCFIVNWICDLKNSFCSSIKDSSIW